MHVVSETETKHTIDSDGSEHIVTVAKTTKVERLAEPDYIKIYTEMWCAANQIPMQYRNLFLHLVCRMTYASLNDIEGGQIVTTSGVIGAQIRRELGWKEAMFYKALAALCDCGAIRKVSRGQYQINPAYAGKGEWKYNPTLDRGGIENIIAKFDLKKRSIDTKIFWADDGSSSQMNHDMREGLTGKPDEPSNIVMSEATIPPADK